MGKIVGIYKITSPSNRIYIGQSVNILHRFYSYLHLMSCKSQIKLYNSLLKYGPDNHTFEIIKECKVNELNYYERHFQEYYNVLGEFGLNLKYTNVGSKKVILSNDSIEKIRNTHIEKHKNGYIHPMKNKKHKDSSKKKMSEAKKGKYNGNKNNMYGRNHTEETKLKISLTHTKPCSKKVINNITGEIFDSIKIAFNSQSDIKTYYTFRDKLNGRIKNNTPYEHYLKKN
jgi:group I intron endonuclease